uniref:Uncharacterized protein n=1 Tax=Lepeophtheirus salmonis TaxID=72036 RepID=A0A0K2VLK2_LEPSM
MDLYADTCWCSHTSRIRDFLCYFVHLGKFQLEKIDDLFGRTACTEGDNDSSLTVIHGGHLQRIVNITYTKLSFESGF